jgi:hypothetical protein
VRVSPADTVQIIMKTSNDGVKECIAKVIFIRNKRHLPTFLNTKASVNPTAFYGLKLLRGDRSSMPRVASCQCVRFASRILVSSSGETSKCTEIAAGFSTSCLTKT